MSCSANRQLQFCAAPADAVLDYLDSKNWGLHTLQIPQQFKFDHLTITQQLDQGKPFAPGIGNHLAEAAATVHEGAIVMYHCARMSERP